jgi:hypothetical protein
MVFQVPGKIFQEEFAERHGPQFTSKGAHNVLARNWPIPNLNLHEFDIGAILIVEQIDVRHVLLADLPVAPAPGARTSLRTEINFFCFLY